MERNKEVINNSILSDDVKTMNLVRNEIDKRGISNLFVEIPNSFEEIEETIFKQMREIDRAQQYNLISIDDAINMIANLFERDGLIKRFEKHIDDVLFARIKKLFQSIDDKYQDLLFTLNTGKISQTQFQEELSKLHKFEKGSIQDIFSQIDNLRGYSK